MANLSTIRKEIFKFLNTKEPEVLAIKGDWGIGKTYAWEQCVKEARDKGEIALDSYSYVSLFGIDSIDKLRFAIFEKNMPVDEAGEKPNPRNFKNQMLNLASFVSSEKPEVFETIAGFVGFGSVGKIVDKGISHIAGNVAAFASIHESIVCLDDFERTTMDIQDILGVISELKEKKNCKVVLIFNEQKLPAIASDSNVQYILKASTASTEDAEHDVALIFNQNAQTSEQKYKEYREKVIDIDLNFFPTAEESASICFDDKYNPIPDSNILKEICCELELKNIRIMHKAVRIWKELCALKFKSFDITKQRIAMELIIFVCSIHEVSTVPKIGDIKREYEIQMDGEKIKDKAKILSERKKFFERQNSVKQFFSKHKLYHPTEMDRQILCAAENGYFDVENLRLSHEEYVNNYNKNEKQQEKLYRHNLAWEKYHDNFDNNIEEVVQSIYDETIRCIDLLSLISFYGSPKVLSDLGYKDKSDELLSLYIEKGKDTDPLNLMHLRHVFKEVNEDFVQKIEQKNEEKMGKMSLLEVLDYLSTSSGCDDIHSKTLNTSSIEDFYNAFKEYRNINRRKAIKNCLAFTDIDKQKNIMEALKKIESESPLNEMRVNNILRN